MNTRNEGAGLLEGKKVLIIGGGGDGIGRAVTRAVAREGAAGVVVVGRSLVRAEEAVREIAGPACAAHAVAADVTVAADLAAATRFTLEKLGGLDALITVVGGIGNYVPWQPLDATPDEDWDLMFDVNVTYVFRLLRDVLKIFTAQPSGGSIVCVGSTAAVSGVPYGAPYGAAKAALASLAKSVGAEYGRRNIRMNVVNSGAVMTEALAKGFGASANFEPVPMGRAGLPEEVADMAVFLASWRASYITGQSINVDGGMTARGTMPMAGTDSSMTCHCAPAHLDIDNPS